MILLSRISFTHAKKASTSGFTDCCLLSIISCDDLPLLRLSVWKITAILFAASPAICCAGDNAAPFFAVFTISAYLRLQWTQQPATFRSSCFLFRVWQEAYPSETRIPLYPSRYLSMTAADLEHIGHNTHWIYGKRLPYNLLFLVLLPNFI